MRILIAIIFFTTSIAEAKQTAPFPVFLKAGYSTILEFDEVPSRVVVGNPENFQVEKLDSSLVLKTLSPEGSGNLFVYFKTSDPRLFLLTASDEAEPTFYRKFETSVTPVAKVTKQSQPEAQAFKRSTRILSSKFDTKKDYLTVEIQITADSSDVVRPKWNLIGLTYNNAEIRPTKLWAERREVQRDSRVKARFIFTKPNVPKDLKGVNFLMPIEGHVDSVSINLGGLK